MGSRFRTSRGAAAAPGAPAAVRTVSALALTARDIEQEMGRALDVEE